MKHGSLPLSSSTAPGRACEPDHCNLLVIVLIIILTNGEQACDGEKACVEIVFSSVSKNKGILTIKWHMKVFMIVRCHFFAMLPAFTGSTAKVRTQTLDIGTFYT